MISLVALDHAGFAIIATGMEQCLAGGEGAIEKKDVEKLFHSLA